MPVVTGPIGPTSPSDSYPTHDSLYGLGGLREVADHTARNAITTFRRRAGMLVFTANDSKYWRLNASPWAGDDTDWTEAFLDTSTTQTIGGTKTFSDEVIVPAPVNSTDAVTKSYADGIASGISVKAAVVVSTTTTLPANTYNNGTAGVGATLTANSSGVLTIDGVSPSLNDRILVKDEATAANNGIYSLTTVGDVSTAYVLTRVTDMDQASEIVATYSFVESGTLNIGKGFVVTGAGPWTVGTTDINWTQFSGNNISAGAGLTLTGLTMSLNSATSSGLGGVELTNDFGGTASAPTVVSTHLASALPFAQGGTTGTTQQTAMDALAGTQVSGHYLRSDGTHTTLTAIQVADVPTLNQNTTGTAANVTATLDQIPTAAANVSLGSHKITNLTNGSSAQDAAAFGQIPTSASSIGGLLKANNLSDVTNAAASFANIKQDATSGGTGVIQLTSDLGGSASSPTVTNLHLSGDTSIGHKLTSVTDPTSAQDAATKNYVDTASTAALLKVNNLSDVASATTALANLGGAPLASPALTGTPTAPTATTGTNTTQLATTAFVEGEIVANATPDATFISSGKTKKIVYNLRDFGAECDGGSSQSGTLNISTAVITDSLPDALPPVNDQTLTWVGTGADVGGGISSITLPDPTALLQINIPAAPVITTNSNHGLSDGDQVTISGVSAFIVKVAVRVMVTSNITISNPGTSTFDGLTMVTFDRVLLNGQTDATQNGVYIFNGSSSAMTRATDLDAGSEFWIGGWTALVPINEGTYTGDSYYANLTSEPTLKTTLINFNQWTGTQPSSGFVGEIGCNELNATFPIKLLSATSVLTSTGTNVSDGDTVTIDTVTYRFKTTIVQAYDVHIGGNADATLNSLVKAINNTGIAYTGNITPTGATADYYTGTLINPSVTAISVIVNHQVGLTANTPGSAGNSIVTTETSSQLSFTSSTMTGASDANFSVPLNVATLTTYLDGGIVTPQLVLNGFVSSVSITTNLTFTIATTSGGGTPISIPAGASTSGSYYFGTDDTSAWQSALTAANASPTTSAHSAVVYWTGISMVSQTIVVDGAVLAQGSWMEYVSPNGVDASSTYATRGSIIRPIGTFSNRTSSPVVVFGSSTGTGTGNVGSSGEKFVVDAANVCMTAIKVVGARNNFDHVYAMNGIKRAWWWFGSNTVAQECIAGQTNTGDGVYHQGTDCKWKGGYVRQASNCFHLIGAGDLWIGNGVHMFSGFAGGNEQYGNDILIDGDAGPLTINGIILDGMLGPQIRIAPTNAGSQATNIIIDNVEAFQPQRTWRKYGFMEFDTRNAKPAGISQLQIANYTIKGSSTPYKSIIDCMGSGSQTRIVLGSGVGRAVDAVYTTDGVAPRPDVISDDIAYFSTTANAGRYSAQRNTVTFTADGNAKIYSTPHSLGVVPHDIEFSSQSIAAIGCMVTADAKRIYFSFCTAPASGYQISLAYRIAV